MHVYLSQHNSASASLLQRKSGKRKLYSLMGVQHVKYLFHTPVPNWLLAMHSDPSEQNTI